MLNTKITFLATSFLFFSNMFSNELLFKSLRSEGDFPVIFSDVYRKYEYFQTHKIKKEKDVFERFYINSSQELINNGKIIYGDVVTNYLDQFYGSLKIENELKKGIKIFTVKSSKVEISCYPNGALFVTSGFLSQLENESQLAFFLIHESLKFKYNFNFFAFKNSSKNNKEVELLSDKILNESFEQLKNSGYKYKELKSLLMKFEDNQVFYNKLNKWNPSVFYDSVFKVENKFELDRKSYFNSGLISNKLKFNKKKLTNLIVINFSLLVLEHESQYNLTKISKKILHKFGDSEEELGGNFNSKEKNVQSTFNKILHQIRIQLCYDLYFEHNYWQLYYHSKLLSQNYSDVETLKLSSKFEILSLSIISKYISKNEYFANYDQIIKDETMFYIQFFLSEISPKELNAIVIREAFKKYLKFKNDKEFKELFDVSVKDLIFLNKIELNSFDFNNFFYQSLIDSSKNIENIQKKDSIKRILNQDGLTKVEKLKLVQSIEKSITVLDTSAEVKNSIFYQNAFHYLLKNRDFEDLLKQSFDNTNAIINQELPKQVSKSDSLFLFDAKMYIEEKKHGMVSNNDFFDGTDSLRLDYYYIKHAKSIGVNLNITSNFDYNYGSQCTDYYNRNAIIAESLSAFFQNKENYLLYLKLDTAFSDKRTSIDQVQIHKFDVKKSSLKFQPLAAFGSIFLLGVGLPIYVTLALNPTYNSSFIIYNINLKTGEYENIEISDEGTFTDKNYHINGRIYILLRELKK